MSYLLRIGSYVLFSKKKTDSKNISSFLIEEYKFLGCLFSPLFLKSSVDCDCDVFFSIKPLNVNRYVWRWIIALVKEVTLCLIASHVLTPRTLSPSLMLISLLVLLIFIMQTFSDDKLDTYVLQVKKHASFSSYEDVQSLAMKMVQTKKHLVFPLVYKLIELALILSGFTASDKRALSTMKIIKTKLRNKINNVLFNDLMICYTEREIFKSLDDVDIIQTFTAERSWKGHLPPNFI